MNTLKQLIIIITALASLQAVPVMAASGDTATLPSWQVLEFEEKAFWATAHSRIELLPDEENMEFWLLDVTSSVVGNSETVAVVFEPETGQVLSRSRLSKGKGHRMKRYEYQENTVVRERRNGGDYPEMAPADWPVSSRKNVALPATARDNIITSPYPLLVLAQRLLASDEKQAIEVLVHTDLNIYRVRLSSGNGIPLDVNYLQDKERVQGRRETRAVAIQANPEGALNDDEDFNLLGLESDILLFFDKASLLPLQVTGKAPRIGDTSIKLKSVILRQPPA
ncbi:MAG: hypothetical protein GY764_00455 [Halieaceae bacterium]|nr:hypothetical protein [Halieaceae bacterium]